MKNIKYIAILLTVLLTTACINKSDNQTQNNDQNSFVSTEWIAINSQPALNIDRYLTAMEVLGFSGAIVVSDSDEVVLSKGYGYANREKRQPYTPQTVQSSGSITKQFTGAAILLLESRGVLSVNDTISKYFDQFSEEMQNITIHQLLTHSSGMPGGIGADEEAIGEPAYLDRLVAESLQSNPGSEYAYSNTGYSLLAMIIEQVTGQSYEKFLREELLLPAGMKYTGYILPDWDLDELAIGYRNGEHWGIVYERGWIDDGPNWHLRGNGGIHTTVRDMAKWFKTVQGLGVLGEDVVERWTTGYVTENGGVSNYGYGWSVYDHDRWGKVITHSGSNRIFEADFVWLPEKDLFFYIHGNSSMVSAANQSGNILAAVFDSTFVMPPLVEPDTSAKHDIAQQREGVYYLNESSLELTADDARLMAKLWGQTVFDKMFKHDDEQIKWFTELNRRTTDVMNKLKAGQDDALADLMRQGEDPIEPTSAILKRISQIGNLDSLHVIGTFVNNPDSRFSEYGPWTTFIYAEFANWNQYWNFVWNDDGTFQGEYSGPWPSFTLIPTDNDSYTGVRQDGNWETVELEIRGDCIILMESKACKE
ncbi:serine hydrolase domain-containing protein [Rhodohalobacter barkolensis]|nr:serine hydrolase domain-containing protein [Rhodohalobacter barkolensis]